MNTDRLLIELVDRHEIHQVLLRYARGLDRLDNALARSCYWDDAIEDHGHFVGTPHLRMQDGMCCLCRVSVMRTLMQ